MTRNWKKLLSLLLVLTMLAGMMPAVFAAEDEPAEEPEEQVEEILTDEPEVPEVPDEPETPEEPAETQDPEEPESPEIPDEPETPEEPAREPEAEAEGLDVAGAPEDGEEDESEFDIEIMSEAVSARKEVSVSSSLLNFSLAEYEYYSGYRGLYVHFYITSSFFGTYPDIDGLYVIARSGGIRYYLHYYPNSEITPDCYNEPPYIDSIDYPSLPAGSYDLLMGGINGDGDLVVTQPLTAKLVVLPTPEVSLGAPFDDSSHYFNVKLPKDTTGIEGLYVTPAYDISLSFMLEHAVKGVYSIDVLSDGETYSFEYAGPFVTDSDSGDLIVL